MPHFELREFGLESDFWIKLFKNEKIDRVGFEEKYLSLFQLKYLKNQAKIKFLSTRDLVENLRAVKDSSEIKHLKKAAQITDLAFDYIFKNISSGQSEKEISWELEKCMRQAGASKNAWESLIVAVGEHSSMAHYLSGETKIKKRDLVLLDFGCVFEGYHSDMTRVIFLGTPNTKEVQIYNHVLQAQETGIGLLKAGVSGELVDKKVREKLEGFNKFSYRHGLGHGVGLEVHELPRLNSLSKEKLVSGNVVTVEPGIYEPHWGGVRIEDMVLVGEKRSETLTKSAKKLSEITKN